MADELPEEYWITRTCASNTHVIKTAECPWCTIERLRSGILEIVENRPMSAMTRRALRELVGAPEPQPGEHTS